ncbi:MAG: hypothetical protein ABI351_13140 [Herbaspirillum sp.]
MENTKAMVRDLLAKPAEGENFPVPMSVEELHRHLLKIYFLKMRSIAFMTDSETGFRTSGKPLPPNVDFLDPSLEPGDFGLTYGDIQDTEFATCMESMYQYAYFGIMDDVVNGSINYMEYGSNFTLAGVVAYDMAHSRADSYWDEVGGITHHESAVLCYQFVEVANARCILENQRNFLYYEGSAEEDAPSYDRQALSVPQMALLAGMGEMSIRAAANPKRTNPLKTYSESGRTRIAIMDAKAWLQSKGRYVPITRRSDDDLLRLAKRKFTSFEELDAFAQKRATLLATTEGKIPKMSSLDRTLILSDAFVRGLAQVLQLPVDLFSLRVQELVAKNELAQIERKLESLSLLSAPR